MQKTRYLIGSGFLVMSEELEALGTNQLRAST